MVPRESRVERKWIVEWSQLLLSRSKSKLQAVFVLHMYVFCRSDSICVWIRWETHECAGREEEGARCAWVELCVVVRDRRVSCGGGIGLFTEEIHVCRDHAYGCCWFVVMREI